MRWDELGARDPRRKTYIPFGPGRLEYPAKSVFGPMMIGLLVGTLMGEVGAK